VVRGRGEVGSDVDKGDSGSECMQMSATLLVTYHAAVLQQCTAILITPPVTALAVLNRPLWLWSLDL